MSGPDTIQVARGGARKHVNLTDYLDGSAEEQARQDEYTWIKQVRHASIDGVPLRRRFTYRGDSLWWFAELYLHKRQAILDLHRWLIALERVVGQEAPDRVAYRGPDRPLATALHALGRSRRLTVECRPPVADRASLARLSARSSALHAAALLSRVRPRAVPDAPAGAVVAFVHRAFLREAAAAAAAEAYIGPVLQVLEQRAERGVHYVSLGPASNFDARRWWHPIAPGGERPATPIEAYAPLGALRDARGLFKVRREIREALWRSPDLRELACIGGADCWALVREELAGIALLQFPWSARAMDEAAAALDRLAPAVALTYAEAGGWGRALVLECRRRGIPLAGLQHGFIYRHWLNYRHEPDEMVPDPGNARDAGFPRPTRTLLFDGYAAQHLMAAGRFPEEAVAVTGSPRLDATADAVRRATPEATANARRTAGARDGDALLLVVAKAKEARRSLPELIQAAGAVAGVHVAIKTHPAETPEAYAAWTTGRPHVSVLPASAPLAPLLAAARAVATVNSTVALDAAVLGIPALVVGLPNNLSPFVDAGALAGGRPEALVQDIRQILYDEEFRERLGVARRALLARYRMASDGQASARTAAAVLRLAAGRPLTEA